MAATMRRNTQLWLGGAVVVVLGLGSLIFHNQNEQITQQKQALVQQELVAKLLKERNADEARFRKQESKIAMQLKNLDAEQAKNAAAASADQASLEASRKSSLERDRLESKIQDFRLQKAQRDHQNDCLLMQIRIKQAEAAQQFVQAKTLQEQWNDRCERG